MARKHPNRRLPGWLSLRRRAALVPVAVALVGLLVAVTAAGWAGWLVDHPGQAWQWVVRHWFVPPALAVVVALLTAWATWAAPRAQQRRAEQLAKVQHARQERLEQERLARQREQAAAARQAAWARRCRELLARWPLPAVEEVDPYEVGVFYSRRADAYRGQQPRPPYVPRAVDQELAALLDSQPLVLLKGRSRAGKSRTAFEVAVHVLAGWRLLVPKDRAALTQLRDLQPLPGEGERILVWLDDLDQYLATEGTGGLDAGLLARLAACDPPMQVLATIRLEEHARLSAAPGELGRAVRGLLNRFDPGAVTLPVGFDEPAERAAISELYPDEAVSGGLAEHLAAAHELVDWLEHGEATVPEGAGLVLAAVDRRRAGLDRPASREDLAALLPLYLQQLRPLVPFQEGDVARGLAWATEPLGRTAAPLVADPSPPGSFRVAEPIVDHVERRTSRRLTIAAVWDRLLAQASLEEAMAIAFAAHTRGERRPAEAALQQVIDSGDPDHAPSATFNLGVLLIDDGDVAGARAAFQQVIDSGHPHEAPMAADNLGLLLLEAGDVAGARAAFQQAVESGDAEAAPMGAVGTGLVLTKEGNAEGARAAFQQAIDSGEAHAAPMAAFHLGNLLAGQEDMAATRAAYLQAIESGHPDFAPMAAANLGMVEVEKGDVAGARMCFQQVLNSGHPEAVPAAAVSLGVLLKAQGGLAGARAAYQLAIDTGHPDVAPGAAVNLGVLLKAQGGLAGARAAYQRAIDTGHADHAPRAAFNLWTLLAEQGEVAGARTAYQRAIESGHPDAVAAVAAKVGTLLAEQGHAEGARTAYQLAIDTGHADHAPGSAVNLGALLAEQGDAEGARAAYQLAVLR